MYQVIVEKNGKKLFANCTFEQVQITIDRAKKAGMSIVQVLCKKTVGTKPTEAKLPHAKGYRKNVPDGWVALDDSTISGFGYTVKFSRKANRTIDPMCDALNGWYAEWDKIEVELIDAKGKLTITTLPEKADRIWEIVRDTKKDEDHTEAENVRIGFEAIVNFVAEKKYTIYKMNFVGSTWDYDYRLAEGLDPEKFKVGDWCIVDTSTNGKQLAIIVAIVEQTRREMKYAPDEYSLILRKDEKGE